MLRLLPLFVFFLAWGSFEDDSFILIPDGSEAYLKYGSSLTYFPDEPRRVELTGFATFIVKDAPAPMSVYMTRKGYIARMKQGSFSVSKWGLYISSGSMEIVPVKSIQEEKNIQMAHLNAYLIADDIK